jgi:negative modulator of initiation of replication
MKTIEVDDELYRYIASHTRHIGERIRHFTAHAEIFRRFPACYTGRAAPAPAATPAVK